MQVKIIKKLLDDMNTEYFTEGKNIVTYRVHCFEYWSFGTSLAVQVGSIRLV